MVAVLLLTAEWRRIAAGNEHLQNALAANPFNAVVRRDYLNAQLDIARTDPSVLADVAKVANQGVAIHPEDGRFNSALGAVDLLSGNDEAARAQFSAAIDKTPDESLALRVHFIDAVNGGEREEALEHLSRIAYRWSGTLAELRPLILTLFDNQSFRAEAAAFLSDKPDLRQRIVRQLLGDIAAYTAALDLITLWHAEYELDVSGQAASLISLLFRAGRVQEAIILDKSIFEATRGTGGGFVNNGDFSQVPSQSPFDWRFPKITGVSIDQITAPDPLDLTALRSETGVDSPANPRTLRLSFLNSPSRLNPGSWQTLVLPQGSYGLEVIHRTSANYSTPRPVALQIRCRGSNVPKAEIVLSMTGNRWERQNASFDIDPASENCRTPFVTFYSEPVAQSWRNQFSGIIDVGLIRLVRQQ